MESLLRARCPDGRATGWNMMQRLCLRRMEATRWKWSVRTWLAMCLTRFRQRRLPLTRQRPKFRWHYFRRRRRRRQARRFFIRKSQPSLLSKSSISGRRNLCWTARQKHMQDSGSTTGICIRYSLYLTKRADTIWNAPTQIWREIQPDGQCGSLCSTRQRP